MHTRSLRSRSRSQSKTYPSQKSKKSPIKNLSKLKTPEKTPEKLAPSVQIEPEQSPPVQNQIKPLDSSKKKSYLDILKEYIDHHDSQHMNLEKSPNFTLMEDMKIIYEMAKDDKEQTHLSIFWKNLSNGIINRNSESIRTRYKNYLKFLEKDDFDKIIEHLKEKGSYGYVMKFTVDENNPKRKRFQGVIAEEKDKAMSSSKRIQEIVNEKKKVEKGKNDEIKIKLNENKLIQHIRKYEGVLFNNNISIENVWKGGLQSEETEQFNENELKNFMVTSNFNQRWVSSQSEGQSAINVLDVSLAAFEKKYGVDATNLIEALTAVSGDIKDLEELLENPNNNNLKWLAEDDHILTNCKDASDFGFSLLRRYKGDERIKKRLAFLKIELSFQF